MVWEKQVVRFTEYPESIYNASPLPDFVRWHTYSERDWNLFVVSPLKLYTQYAVMTSWKSLFEILPKKNKNKNFVLLSAISFQSINQSEKELDWKEPLERQVLTTINISQASLCGVCMFSPCTYVFSAAVYDSFLYGIFVVAACYQVGQCHFLCRLRAGLQRIYKSVM